MINSQENESHQAEVQQSEATHRELDDIVSPGFLELLSRSTTRFGFSVDPKLPYYRLGYTQKMSSAYSEIYVNKYFLNGGIVKGKNQEGEEVEYQIPPATQEAAEGFLLHESGHHAPWVLKLDNKLKADLADPDIIPEVYKGNPRSEERFLISLYTNLHNALNDMWLEAYAGRRPYYPIGEKLEALMREQGPVHDMTAQAKPQQLLQVLLREQYFEVPNLREVIEPDVYEAHERIMNSGAFAAILDRRAFETAFPTDAAQEKSIDRKYLAYKQVILPEYLALLEAELEKRKKQKQEEQGDGPPMPGRGGGSGGESGDPVSDSVPLTAEEEQDLIDQILSELEKYGEKHAEHNRALSEEEREAFKDLIDMAKRRLQDIRDGKDIDDGEEGEVKGKKGMDSIADEAERIRREQRREAQRGLAGSLQVREQSVQQWEQIKEKRRDQIESLAASIAEIFVDDRQKKMEFLKREGSIVPGLEYEYIAAILSGDLSPETHMMEVRNPEFLETEHEDIFDTSGSMAGMKLRMSIELAIIKIEAFKKAREILDAEQLVATGEDPMRVGVTKFSDAPERVASLDEPNTDEKEIRIIDRVSMVGGGTDETEALRKVYKGMRLRKNNVIKFITVLTDGQGNKAGVAPIMRQIEQDDEVIFLVVALGDDQAAADAIVQTYLRPLKDRDKNVFAIAAVDPEEVIPQVVDFYKQQVEKRKQDL
jgi:DNA-binding XRE family transcriptional regulator